MNAPTAPSPHDQLLEAQANTLSAVDALHFALTGGSLLAFGCEMVEGPLPGIKVPQFSLVFVENNEKRVIRLKAPEHPPFVPALLALAGQAIMQKMRQEHEASGAHGAWMKHAHGVQELRESNKRRIILPGRN